MNGVIVNLLSPMTEDGELDFPAFSRLIWHLYSKGVTSFWIFGSAGEDFSISVAQKLSFIRAFDDLDLPPSCNYAIGISSSSPQDTQHLIEAANGSSIITSIHYLCYDQKLGSEQYLSYVKYLTSISLKPLYLYHNPKRGRPLSATDVKSLSDNNLNLGGIKIGGYSLSDFLNFKKNSDPSWTLFCAGSAQMLPCLKLGFSSHSSSDANTFPVLFSTLYDSFMSGRLLEAEKAQDMLIRLSQMIQRNNNGEYSAEEKYLVSLQLDFPTYVNKTYSPASCIHDLNAVHNLYIQSIQ